MKERNLPADVLKSCVGFYKEIVTDWLGFAYLSYRYVSYYNKAKAGMGERGNRNMSRTHSLFVDDLKQYQEIHKVLKYVNEIIVQASHDTGACYGVSNCAEIVFEHEKMVRREGVPVLDEGMETMDPDENEIYEFLGVEQADGIKTKIVFERVKSKVEKRVKMLVNTEVNDTNLISAKGELNE